MIIYLGKEGRPNPYEQDRFTVGTHFCNADGFLDTLALHFGVAFARQVDLALELNLVINETKQESDFYFASYKVDPFGVSKRLSALLSEISSASPREFKWEALTGKGRCADLARLAIALRDRGMAQMDGDKLRLIMDRIDSRLIANPFKEIVLADSKDSWPLLWRETFSVLEKNGSLIRQWDSSGDPREIEVLRIEGASVFEAADAAACLVGSESMAGRKTVVICSSEGPTLNDALKRQNLPILGGSQELRGSGPAELLALLLSIAVGPTDPANLLAFMNIEPNPVPNGLRGMLARELGKTGSITLACVNACIEKYLSEVDDPKVRERSDGWKSWLALKDLGVDGQISEENIKKVLAMIETWATKAMVLPGMEPNALASFVALTSSVSQMNSVLTTMPGKAFSKIQVQGLISQVCRTPKFTSIREQSSYLALGRPEELIGRVDTIIWWMAHDSILPKATWGFWSENEREILKSKGIELLDGEQAIKGSYASALRLLQLADHRVVFVCSERVGDDPAEVHPLWYEIENGLVKNCRHRTLKVTDYWREISKTQGQQVVNFPPAAQPECRSEWKIPHAPYEQRKSESPSSLEKMLGCSLAWTLQYRAGLYDKSIHKIPEGILLLGRLAHSCFEAFFKDGGWLKSEAEREKIAESIFDQKIVERAGALMVQGRELDRHGVRSNTIAGMLHLAQIVDSGGWEFEFSEEKVECTDLPQPLDGQPDLVFRRIKSPSERLVVDVKYSGKGKRQRELQFGSAIQLATYSRILRKDEIWPKTAYYIVTTKDLLTVHGDIAPNLYPINGESERDVWSRVSGAIQETQTQLKVGTVQLGLVGEEAKRPSDHGRIIAAPCTYCAFDVFCSVNRSAK